MVFAPLNPLGVVLSPLISAPLATCRLAGRPGSGRPTRMTTKGGGRSVVAQLPVLTRRFQILSSRFNGPDSDFVPDQGQWRELSVSTRARLEMRLMIGWAGIAITIAAAMVVIGFLLHQVSRTVEHFAFYVFVALAAFCLAGMFLHCMRYVVAQLATYREEIRERAGRPHRELMDSPVSLWLTTARDSDFLIQLGVTILVMLMMVGYGL